MRLLDGQPVAHLEVELQQVPAALQIVDADRRARPCRAARRASARVVSTPSWSDLTGSTWTTTSAPGRTSRTACSAATAISCVFSKEASRATVRRTSAKLSGPDRRTRTCLTSTTPGTRAARSTSSRTEAGHAVDQRGDRPAAQLQADVNDDAGHDQRGDRVGFRQRRDAEALREAHEDEAEDDDRRRPDVGREVQRVRFERLAVVLLRGPVEHPGAGPVDRDGDAHDDEGPDVHFDLDVLEEQPLDRLIDDPGTGAEQEERLEKRGEVFDLAVAVGVLFIRGAAREADRHQGDERGNEVKAAVRHLREDAEAAGHDPHDQLEQRQKDGCDHRAERRAVFLAVRDARPDAICDGHSSPCPVHCGASLSATRLARNIRTVPSRKRTLMLMSLPSGRISVISPAPKRW